MVRRASLYRYAKQAGAKLDIVWTDLVDQDFTEVDNNVTRHVPGELLKDDWSGMILHYLGLDHIGHKSGPRRYVPRLLRLQWLTNT